jgi:hypothetical protein
MRFAIDERFTVGRRFRAMRFAIDERFTVGRRFRAMRFAIELPRIKW